MKTLLFKILLFIGFYLVFFNAKSQTLIMNEVSNGPSGNQEYVEFVVVSNAVTYTCTNITPPCIDIRGWIFDDNSGYHGSSGVAAGAVRFSQDPIWACIPLGTIILIYNNADRNPAIPPDDLSMADGNCTIIAPLNSTLFESNTITPGAVACSYPAAGWTAGGNWNNTLLANAGDCARIVDLGGCEVFSVCWATDSLNNLIYFNSGGSGSQNVWYFNGGNPTLQANWSEGSASPSPGNQTPGAPNNAANAAYIAQFNNGCLPITQTSVTAVSVNAGCTCNGSATASASGSIGGYTYVWCDAGMNPIGQTGATATGLCAGVYNVIATSNIGCTATASVTISSSSTTSVTVNSQTICAGTSAILTATPSAGGGSFSWTPGGQTTPTISVSPGSTTTYSVTYTLAGCSVTNNGIVTVKPLPTVTVNSPTICNGQTATLTANGATTYLWNTGSTSNSVIVSPTSNTNFTVIGTANGCTNTAVSSVIVNSQPTITVNSATICSGQTTTINAIGATTYTWNTGSTTNPLSVTPTTNTNYTVIGSSNGCTNTAVSNVVVNAQPTVTVNSSTVCIGQSSSLLANGASSYVWSTGATTNSLNITPISTTNYTVTGSTFGCTNSVVATVSVIPLPNITVNSTTICSGQSATLTATGATNYTWSSGASINSITVSPTSNTNYTVVGATAGCTNSAVSNVSVTPLPTVSVNSTTLCFGSTASLNAVGATSYTWSNGSVLNPLSVAPNSNTTYSVIGAALGCTNSAVASLTVISLPNISVNSSTICSGQNTTINAIGATTYSWNTGAITNSISVSPSTNTNYTVTGTTLGCSNSATLNVLVTPLPMVTVNSNTLCAGQTVTLNATGANTYTWNNGSTTSSIVVSPNSNTSYSVVGAISGCTNIAISSISVTPLPTITVNSSTICSGGSATLSANGSTTYTWSTGSTNFSITDNPAITTTYSVVGEQLGCVNSATAQIVVSPNLVLSVNAPTICAGQTATLVSSGATTYTWSNGTIGNTIIVSPSSTTSFSVSGISGSCSGVTAVNVVVNPLPLVSVNSNTVCAGQTTTITATGATTYSWSNGLSSNFIVDSPLTNSTYTVIGSSLGCTNTAVASISVASLPTLTVNSPTICSGQTTTLTASGASSYIWSNGATTNIITVNPTTNSTYSVFGTTGICSATATANVIVNQSPTITVTSPTICSGETATITASGSASYIWNTGSITNNVITSPINTTTYTVTGTSFNCSVTATTTVIVNDAPVVAFNSDKSFGCAPLCVQFTDLSSISVGTITNWNWTFNDGYSSSLQNPSHCFDSPGTYGINLQVTSSNGCSKTFTNPNLIKVLANPSAEFTSDLFETDVLNPNVHFVNLSSNADSYQWNFDAVSTSTLTNPSHTFDQAGVYSTTLTATNQFGCKSVVIHDIIVRDMFTFYAPNTFTPNEDNVNDVFLPLGVGWDPEKYQLDIFDRWGNNCFNTKEVGKGWDGKANHGSESAQIDTYTWKVDLTDIFGKNHKYIGRVTIIR